MRLRGSSPGSPEGAVYGGLPGRAATVAVGSTTTGSAGSSASVVNAGSSNAAVLNFTVPRGDVGPQGAPGTPGSVTVAGLGDATTISRFVTSTAYAGAADSGKWCKLLTYGIGSNQYYGQSLILGVIGDADNDDSAIITLRMTNAGTTPAANIHMIAKGGNGSLVGSPKITPSSFRVVNNGFGQSFELWMRVDAPYAAFKVYEYANQTNHANAVTWHQAAAWQAGAPTGSAVQVSTNGVTAFGQPVLPTTATVTTPSRLPNYGNAYTALVNLPVSADPSIGSVDALLHFNGDNNSTAIVDSSLVASDWATFGNAKISTAVSAAGTLFLDGAGDYIRATAPAAEFAFGTGDFTIEMRLFLSSLPPVSVLYEGRSSAAGFFPTLFALDNGSLNYYFNNATRITSATNLSINTWHHVAVSRVSGTTRMFLNGVQEGISWTDANNIPAHQPAIGAGGTANFTEFNLNGHIDEVRITNGVGRYSAGFAVPGAAFPDPAAVTLPTAVGNSTVYTIRNTSTSVPLTVNAVGALVDGVRSISVSPGSTVQAGAVGGAWRTAASNSARRVSQTLQGGSDATTGANTWAKIATLSTGTNAFSEAIVLLSVVLTGSNNALADSAIVSAKVRVQGAGGNPIVDVKMLAHSGSVSLGPDSFKIIAGGWNSKAELWMRKGDAFGIFTVYELNQAVTNNATITYHENAQWQSAVPTGTVSNVSTVGVVAGSAPVVTTTGAQTLTNKTINYPTIDNAQLTGTVQANGNTVGAGLPATGYSTTTNQWVKIATITTPVYGVTRLLLAINAQKGNGDPSSLIAAVNVTYNIPTNPGGEVATAEIVSATGTQSFSADAIKITSGGTGTPYQIWVKVNSASTLVQVSELSRNFADASTTVAYHNGAAFQSTATVGASFNFQTSAVTVFGSPVGVRVAVPASSTATGASGQWAANDTHIFVCIASGNWKRAAFLAGSF